MRDTLSSHVSPGSGIYGADTRVRPVKISLNVVRAQLTDTAVSTPSGLPQNSCRPPPLHPAHSSSHPAPRHPHPALPNTRLNRHWTQHSFRKHLDQTLQDHRVPYTVHLSHHTDLSSFIVVTGGGVL